MLADNDIQETANRHSAAQRPGNSHGFFALFASASQRCVLAVVFLSYFAFSVLFQLFPPLLPMIGSQFQVNHSTASLVMTLFLLPILAIALPAGFLVGRYGVKPMGQLAYALLLAGTLMSSAAPSFAILLLGRVISGLGGGLLVIALLTLLAERISQAQRGLALGIFVAGLPVGTGAAFYLLAPLSGRLGWRGEVGIALVLLLGALALFLWGLAPATRRLEGLALVTLLGYTAISGFTAWTPVTLVTFAQVPLWLGVVIATVLLVIDIPFAPLWGAVSDHAGRRKPFILLALSLYLLGSLLVSVMTRTRLWTIPGLLVVIAGMGIGCAMFFPVSLAIPAETVEPEQVGVAYAMLLMAQVGGMLLGPALIGSLLGLSEAAGVFLSVSAVTLAGLLFRATLRGR
jgi:YNFM family putative membrane transporter